MDEGMKGENEENECNTARGKVRNTRECNSEQQGGRACTCGSIDHYVQANWYYSCNNLGHTMHTHKNKTCKLL